MYTNRAPGINTWMASARGNGRSILWADDVFIASIVSTLQLPIKNNNRSSDNFRKLNVNYDSQLSRNLLQNYDFRTTLFSMLRPMDIVALVMSTGIRLTRLEVAKYMIPWKQLFHDLKWVDELEEKSCTATLFGTSIAELASAICNWDYSFDPSRMKFLVIVGQVGKEMRKQTPSWTSHITESFDTGVVWYQVPSFQHILSTLSTSVLLSTIDRAEACVLFLEKGSHFDLDTSWFDILATTMGPLRLCRVGSGTSFPDPTELWRIESQRLKNTQLADSCDLVHMYQPVDPARLEKSFARVYCDVEGGSSIVVNGPDASNW
ncbi:uncharacterized protein EAF01_003721 [Botrytis porri]|uniref:uncharacterized protein n=1 Tax=Botrytis porri TaxID=87229 RepID=UPI00190133BE|nr:uncharacterized protein EAF01_003721 [Botrytis porri]KAF7910003.1 hypothetical protein EAF01_003721 [Botrytis porri]